MTTDEVLKAEKRKLRKEIRQRLEETDPRQIQTWSDRITTKLLALAEYHRAKAIMVYLSLPGEFRTRGLIDDALRCGKVVCGPKVNWRAREMYPARLGSSDDFEVDDHGVSEPRSEEAFAVGKLDLVLVPGLAFDFQGRRLGRGGGFYDRLLSQAELRACKIAAAFDLQIVDRLPVDDHDESVDVIMTPTRMLRFVGPCLPKGETEEMS